MRLFGKKRRILLLLIVGICILAILFSNKLKKPGYTTDTVKKNDIAQTVTQSGAISTGNTVAVYSPSTGVIGEVFVQNGQTVEKDTVLFTVKSTATREESQKAYADYLSAKSALENAQALSYALQSDMFSAWDSYKTLAENDTYEKSVGVPDEEKRTLPQFQTVQKDWLAAEAKFKAQSSVISQAVALSNATYEAYRATQNAAVTAPVTGTVANIAAAPGAGVSATSALAPQPPVLSLSTGSAPEAILMLSEDDVTKLSVGQHATVVLDAIDGKTYEGIVLRKDTIGRLVNGVVRYYAYVAIRDPDTNILPGMNLDATIETQKASGVLTVPNSSVKPYKSGKAVRIPAKTKEGYTFIPVTVGIRSAEYTQITGGLEEGQTIITALASESKKPGLFGM